MVTNRSSGVSCRSHLHCHLLVNGPFGIQTKLIAYLAEGPQYLRRGRTRIGRRNLHTSLNGPSGNGLIATKQNLFAGLAPSHGLAENREPFLWVRLDGQNAVSHRPISQLSPASLLYHPSGLDELPYLIHRPSHNPLLGGDYQSIRGNHLIPSWKSSLSVPNWYSCNKLLYL